jgi:hypothetical protein
MIFKFRAIMPCHVNLIDTLKDSHGALQFFHNLYV